MEHLLKTKEPIDNILFQKWHIVAYVAKESHVANQIFTPTWEISHLHK